MNKIKPWLLLVLVFLAGAAGGVVATRLTLRQFVKTAIERPDVIQGRMERELVRELDLNPQQRREVHEIMSDSRERMRLVRQEFQPRMAAIARETRQQIVAVLTPEQREEFRRFMEKKRQFSPARGQSREGERERMNRRPAPVDR